VVDILRPQITTRATVYRILQGLMSSDTSGDSESQQEEISSSLEGLEDIAPESSQ
jgi:hypothetical protein